MTLAAAVAAIAASPASARTPPREDAATRALQERAQRAAQALMEVDTSRMERDKAYAEELLSHIQVLLPLAEGEEEALAGLRTMRLLTLHALGRKAEAARLAAEMLETKPRLADGYGGPWAWATLESDPARMVEVVEAAAANITDAEQAAQFYRETVASAGSEFHARLAGKEREPLRFRLAEALVKLGAPGEEERGLRDSYRATAAVARLRRGDLAGARELVRRIDEIDSLLELLPLRANDPLFDGGPNRLQLLGDAMSRMDASTARAVEDSPQDFDALLKRVGFLRLSGRGAEALGLALPAIADMSRVDKGGENAFWLVNEAAYALVDAGRPEEAVETMRRLVSLDMEKHPDLINMAINHGAAILPDAGRNAEAVEWAMRLDRERTRYASTFGRMWIWASIACNLAAQKKDAEAAPWLEKVKALSSDNRSAHLQALLCLNRMEDAERLVLARLAEPDPSRMVVAMQDWERTPAESPKGFRLHERWNSLRDRPAVREAFDKVGRRISLPLARTYWGQF